MKYIRKTAVVEAITFDELVKYGKENGGNIVNGMPWSFNYKGYPISHENDKCYLISTLEGTHHMTPNDMLVTDVEGEICPLKLDIFEANYERFDVPPKPPTQDDMYWCEWCKRHLPIKDGVVIHDDVHHPKNYTPGLGHKLQ